jgi:hypothetical protein
LIDCFTEKNCQYICKTGEIENKNAWCLRYHKDCKCTTRQHEKNL